MSAYAAVMRARFRLLLQYRAAAAAGFVTQVFWGLIRVMIFEAFYRSTTQPQPMALPDVITYVWLGQALIMTQPWNPDSEVAKLIRSGGVAYELLRPLDLYGFWFSRAVAQRTAPTVLRAIPMFVLAISLLGMKLPADGTAALGWIAAMATAVLVSAGITALLNISLLFTVSGEGIARILPAFVLLLTGLIVPLPLFPDWAQGIIHFLPFRDVADVPYRIYTGNIAAAQIPGELIHGLIWSAALFLFGRWILQRTTRRVVIQGG